MLNGWRTRRKIAKRGWLLSPTEHLKCAITFRISQAVAAKPLFFTDDDFVTDPAQFTQQKLADNNLGLIHRLFTREVISLRSAKGTPG